MRCNSLDILQLRSWGNKEAFQDSELPFEAARMREHTAFVAAQWKGREQIVAKDLPKEDSFAKVH
jgi:hypothetical protein